MLEKMLIKSKPRHPIVGPITDFSCQNVFYMPQKLPKRPSSIETYVRFVVSVDD